MKQVDRQYWLWVTRPNYYLDKNGKDNLALEPDAKGSWTCHRDTRKGDLILLWRTSPRKDIAYVIEAVNDAYALDPSAYAGHSRWKHGCDYRVLCKLEVPVTIEDLHMERRLQHWSAYSTNFQGRAFRIGQEHWLILVGMLLHKNPDIKEILDPKRGVTRERRNSMIPIKKETW